MCVPIRVAQLAKRTGVEQKVAVLSALEGRGDGLAPTPFYRHSGLNWVDFKEQVAALERAGYVKRSTSDNGFTFQITPQGVAVLSEARAVIESLNSPSGDC
jgi:predicted transcriptional regulator